MGNLFTCYALLNVRFGGIEIVCCLKKTYEYE